MRQFCVWPVAAAVLLMHAPRCLGQQQADPLDLASLHLGPVGLTPTATLATTNDDNVFYDTTDPKSDFITTLLPQAQAWMKIGPGLLSAKASAQYVHFSKYTNQGGLGTDDTVRFEMPLSR